MRTATKRHLVTVLLVAAAALVASGVVGAEPPAISGKRAQAQAVMAQMEEIDMRLGRTVEAFNGARLRLSQIEQTLAETEAELTQVQADDEEAQRRLQSRLVSLYTGGEAHALEVLLGATSLSDAIDAVDTAGRIADQDAEIVETVRRHRRELAAKRQQLRTSRAEQAKVVDEQAARRRAIEGELASRQRLYESIRGEIQQLEAQERQRQERLAAQARAQAARAARQQSARSRPAPLAAPSAEAPPVTAAPVEPGADPAPAPEEPSAPLPPARGGVVGTALQYLGVPYRWGGASPSGFDCSGFVMYVFAKHGMSVPHYTGSIWGMGRSVPKSQLQPGDLVFFNGLGHMGIYIGGGNMVHAPSTGDVVKISSINSSWYLRTYVGARRL